MRHLDPPTALLAGAFILAPLALTAQCGSTVPGTSGNPIPLTIGTESGCVTNFHPVPTPTTDHGSGVTPLGCGATQQWDTWFSFTTNATETLVRLHGNDSTGAGFMVYDGGCDSVMNLVACAGYDTAFTTAMVAAIVPTVPGTTYHVRVSRWGSDTFSSGLRICAWNHVRAADLPICDPMSAFEHGTTAGWTCRYGQGNAGLTMDFPHIGCLNPGGPNAPLSPGDGTTQPWNAGNRHTLTSDKRYMDPRTNYTVGSVAPGGGDYSFRLGNNDHGCAVAGGPPCPPQASSIGFDLYVTPQNTRFTYRFAAVMQDGGHAPDDQPRFEARVMDTHGNILNCGYFLIIAGSGMAQLRQGPGDWQYTDWTEVGLDILPYVGQTVTIEFRVANCNHDPGTGGSCTHSAYAYIDTHCVFPPCDPDPPRACDEVCLPCGYDRWPPLPGLIPPLDRRCVRAQVPVTGTNYVAYMEIITGCPVVFSAVLRGIPLTMTRDTTVCLGDSIDLIGTVLDPIEPPYTQLWEPGGMTGAGPHRVAPTRTTTYRVFTTDGTNCTVESRVTVTVDPDCGVGIGGSHSIPRLELFPNPVGDRLTIKLDPNVRVEGLRVMDAQGRTVMERRGPPVAALDVGMLAPGAYAVRVDTERGAMAGRFLKD